MYKENIFGKITDDDGYSYGISGKNYAYAKNKGIKYYIFFESLSGNYVQLDYTSVKMKRKNGENINDERLKDEIISKIIGFFYFVGFDVVNS